MRWEAAVLLVASLILGRNDCTHAQAVEETSFPTVSPNTESPTLEPTSPFPTQEPTTPFPTFEPTVTFAPTQSSLVTLLKALQDISLNPDALDDRTTPENAAMRWMYETVTRPSSTLTLQHLINQKFRLQQRFAMATLDFATRGGRPETPKHSAGGRAVLSECQWSGVTCNSNGRITKIKWPGEGLKGFISQDIGLLTRLSYLDLGENQLGGTLPDSLYDLTALSDLYLHSNRIGGPFSERIANLFQLESLYLGDNKLTGRIPQGLGSPNSSRIRPLRRLNLNHNQFTGRIPSNMNLRNLWYLDLGHNQLTGQLPADWWQGSNTLSSLRHLFVNNNNLSGAIPVTFVNIGNGRLVQLAVEHNQFSGIFPGGWSPVEFLEALSIQFNDFDAYSFRLCGLVVFNGGELTSFGSDCRICPCGPPFCRTPHCYFESSTTDPDEGGDENLLPDDIPPKKVREDTSKDDDSKLFDDSPQRGNLTRKKQRQRIRGLLVPRKSQEENA